MNKKSLLIGIFIYTLIMVGFWAWFMLGAYYLASSNEPRPLRPEELGSLRVHNETATNNIDSEQDANAITPIPQVTHTITQLAQSAQQEIGIGSGIPKTISIEKIKVKTSVERVGLDSEGLMAVPSSYSTVGWYELGHKVGGRGSAVISGHYDNTNGQPAVFWDIEKLENGDLIELIDTSNIKYTYSVVEKNVYPYDGLPMQRVFAANDKNMLNLITCSGTWDRTSSNYSTRTVIYAQQIN